MRQRVALALVVVLSLLLTETAVAYPQKGVYKSSKAQKNTHVCALQPDGYIYDKKINSSCRESRKLVNGQVCWKCYDPCSSKQYPYTTEHCEASGLNVGENSCTTIDGIKRYKTCQCPEGYYALSELNYNPSLFQYRNVKETQDGKYKCYQATDCVDQQKITKDSGLKIKGNYAWKTPCSMLKIVSSLKNADEKDNFYCAVGVECSSEFNCHKILEDKECVVKEADTSLTSYYKGEDNKCYYYKECMSGGLCVDDDSSDCVNVENIAVGMFNIKTQATKNVICRKFLHGKNGCKEGFSLTKKYLCTRFDRTPKTADGEEADSFSYDKEEKQVSGLTQSCRKYVECKFGYEEYKPKARGTLTAEDIEKAKENGAYEVTYVKSINGEQEDFLICRKFIGCQTDKCNVSCKGENAWLRYFLPQNKEETIPDNSSVLNLPQTNKAEF